MDAKRIFEIMTPEEEIYRLHEMQEYSRGVLTEVHIADLHFGVLNAETQYNILKEQFLNKITNINFDILSVDGDIFDHKFMSNSDATMYATKFISEAVDMCRQKNATLIIIYGTESHDASQLKLFYHYLDDPTIDIRIVENTKFEYIKGAKILCIPEEYGKGNTYYNNFLNNGMYDSVFMHGMLRGAVYQDKNGDKGLDSDKAPIFGIDDFYLCRGPIISGHVHVPGCFNSYFYYCGSPYTWQFGEGNDKGFLIVLHNLDTHEHYAHFESIKSFRYETINLDSMLMDDPKNVIQYVSNLKQEQGIDYIRIEFNKEPIGDEVSNMEVIKNYYKNNSNIKLKINNSAKDIILKQNQEVLDMYKEYDYILDSSLSEYEILTRYINQQKGYKFIETEELISIIKETI